MDCASVREGVGVDYRNRIHYNRVRHECGQAVNDSDPFSLVTIEALAEAWMPEHVRHDGSGREVFQPLFALQLTMVRFTTFFAKVLNLAPSAVRTVMVT